MVTARDVLAFKTASWGDVGRLMLPLGGAVAGGLAGGALGYGAGPDAAPHVLQHTPDGKAWESLESLRTHAANYANSSPFLAGVEALQGGQPILPDDSQWTGKPVSDAHRVALDADTNGDGRLSASELVTAQDKHLTNIANSPLADRNLAQLAGGGAGLALGAGAGGLAGSLAARAIPRAPKQASAIDVLRYTFG